MPQFFAYNGDADGLCALQQLRLAERPQDAILITGVKRDIKLLSRINAQPGDEVTALDVSLDSNREGLLRLLDAGIPVRYFDHHHAGELPTHAHFTSYIDTSPQVCTSLLVDRFLGGRYHAWAITAAFGDSLPKVAHALAQQAGYSADTIATLERLGICLNYNAYGESITDLHFDPVELAAGMLPYADPLDFARESAVCAQLFAGYEADMALAHELSPLREVPGALLLVLPDAAWARRVIGVLANELMHEKPGSAIALLSPRANGSYTVSLRVPASSPVAADEFCRRFPTGGGRRTAAGINELPTSELHAFAASFEAQFADAAA